MFEEIYAALRKVPAGYVVTYGQIARAVGSPGAARTVGWALRALCSAPQNDVPWHRVVNAKGEIRTGQDEANNVPLQRLMLEEEGVEFIGNHVDMARFQWNDM